MKKRVCSVMAMVMLTGVLAGCGSGTAGGGSQSISVITREEGSGTRDAFVEITGVLSDDFDNTTPDAIVHDSTGKVMTAVANDPNGLGYISLGSLNDTVKPLSVDGVEATGENISNGDYKLARPFNIALLRNSALDDTVVDFINFIFSAEGQDLVENSGFIKAQTDGNPFESIQPSGVLSIGGSTSVYPVMEKLKEAYLEFNTNMTSSDILIEGVGSSGGMNGAIDGTFQIGMASRDLKDSELETLDGIVIARDGIAMIVNEGNALEDISMTEIKDVYVGDTTEFSELVD